MNKYITQLPKGKKDGNPIEQLCFYTVQPDRYILAALNYAIETYGQGHDLKPFEELVERWGKIDSKHHTTGWGLCMEARIEELQAALALSRSTPTYRTGDEVEVSDDGERWYKKIYAYSYNNFHQVGSSKDKVDEAHLYSYAHIRPVSPVTEITQEELIAYYEKATGEKIKVTDKK